MRKILTGLVLGLGVFVFAGTKIASASEGTFELINQVGDDARCFATSILMPNLEYEILVSCRDILYPGGTEVFSYVTWANPVDGGNPVKLGTLDLGKVQFSTKKAFGSLYVTKEVDAKVRAPEGSVVMQGSLQRITILDNPNAVSAEKPELGNPEASPTPAPKSSPLNVLRIGGVVAFVLLVLILGLIFVITRG